jgi:hypothetical protein
MLRTTRSVLAVALSLALAAHAQLPDGRLHANVPPRPSTPKITADDSPVTDISGSILPPLNTTYYFNQLIDHTNPSLGTFKQRYWHTWEWYEEGKPSPPVKNSDLIYYDRRTHYLNDPWGG